jgi:hypothetical protein
MGFKGEFRQWEHPLRSENDHESPNYSEAHRTRVH